MVHEAKFMNAYSWGEQLANTLHERVGVVLGWSGGLVFSPQLNN